MLHANMAQCHEGQETERIQGNLRKARLFFQIDIGLDDIVLPAPSRIAYPVLLLFPAPVINAHTRESTIAEKFHAMVKLGILNSRMKGFFDMWPRVDGSIPPPGASKTNQWDIRISLPYAVYFFCPPPKTESQPQREET
jgi:hypothetical protein